MADHMDEPPLKRAKVRDVSSVISTTLDQMFDLENHLPDELMGDNTWTNKGLTGQAMLAMGPLGSKSPVMMSPMNQAMANNVVMAGGTMLGMGNSLGLNNSPVGSGGGVVGGGGGGGGSVMSNSLALSGAVMPGGGLVLNSGNARQGLGSNPGGGGGQMIHQLGAPGGV
uniref:Uncharacterized protein n=1 Tax=Anopheles atroparvus TaxID=41427 RepID=A0A182J4C6_ANOAO